MDSAHDHRAKEPQPVASLLGPRFYDWQLVQSSEESRRERHLHARNLLGVHDYAMLLVDLIERRAAEGGDYLSLLSDTSTQKLAGESGYVAILFEIRARQVLYESAYWNMMADLRNGGHLNQDDYGRLLDKLHAGKLIDDVDYRRRSGRAAPTPENEPLPEVAERESDYNARDGQKDFFD